MPSQDSMRATKAEVIFRGGLIFAEQAPQLKPARAEGSGEADM